MTASGESDPVRTIEALEGELRRFEALTTEATSIALDSKESLELAAELVERLTEASERLDARAAELGAALSTLRARREASTSSIAAWGANLKPRADGWMSLRARVATLDEAATTVEGLLAQGIPSDDLLDAAEDAVHRLVTETGRLADESRRDGYRDLVDDLEVLQRSLLDAARRLSEARSGIN